VFINQREVDRQTDRERKGDQTTCAETYTHGRWSITMTSMSSRRLGIQTSSLCSNLLVINSVCAAGQ